MVGWQNALFGVITGAWHGRHKNNTMSQRVRQVDVFAGIVL